MEKKESLPLLKASEFFKLIIPQEVKDKIDIHCLEVPNLEWSGTLFYTYTGSYTAGDLVVTLVDFYLQDIGKPGFTEFQQTPDVVTYMLDKQYFDCSRGLIHSHNTMHTFFSGTDTATLQSEGEEMDYFLSVVVNNAGVYTAAITAKVTVETKTTYKILYKDAQKTVEKAVSEPKDCLEYTMFDIEIVNGRVPVIDEMRTRIKEIAEYKKAQTSICNYQREIDFKESKDLPFSNRIKLDDTTYIPKYYTEKTTTVTETVGSFDVEEYSKKLNNKAIDRLSKELLMCCASLPNYEKLKHADIVKAMPTLFEKFSDTEYDYFMQSVAENLLDNYTDEVIEHDSTLTPEEKFAALSYGLISIYEQLPVNSYINKIISYLELNLIIEEDDK